MYMSLDPSWQPSWWPVCRGLKCSILIVLRTRPAPPPCITEITCTQRHEYSWAEDIRRPPDVLHFTAASRGKIRLMVVNLGYACKFVDDTIGYTGRKVRLPHVADRSVIVWLAAGYKWSTWRQWDCCSTWQEWILTRHGELVMSRTVQLCVLLMCITTVTV